MCAQRVLHCFFFFCVVHEVCNYGDGIGCYVGDDDSYHEYNDDDDDDDNNYDYSSIDGEDADDKGDCRGLRADLSFRYSPHFSGYLFWGGLCFHHARRK